MLKYEVKKLLFKPTVLLLLLMSFLVFAGKTYRLIANYIIFVENGTMRGMDAIKKDKKNYQEKFQGLLTDEKIKNDLKSLKQDIQNRQEDSSEKAAASPFSSLMFYDFSSYYFWIHDTYEKDWDDLFADIDKLEDFYHTRRDLLLHRNERSDWTPTMKNYVSNMTDKSEVPFMYGYHTGWKYFEIFMNHAIYFLIVIGIAVLGVFADEEKTGMYSVLLSAKNGRGVLLKTKMKAVFVMFLFAASVIVGGAVLANAVSFGFDGYHLPIQIENVRDFLPINFFQRGVLNVVLKLFNILFIVVYAAFLSSCFKKKEYGVLCLVLPFLLRYSMRIIGADAIFGTEVLKYIHLLPIFSMNPNSAYLYPCFGVPVNYYQAAILLQSLLILLLTVLTVRKLKRAYAM